MQHLGCTCTRFRLTRTNPVINLVICFMGILFHGLLVSFSQNLKCLVETKASELKVLQMDGVGRGKVKVETALAKAKLAQN